jgi:hypothetical protein
MRPSATGCLANLAVRRDYEHASCRGIRREQIGYDTIGADARAAVGHLNRGMSDLGRQSGIRRNSIEHNVNALVLTARPRAQ